MTSGTVWPSAATRSAAPGRRAGPDDPADGTGHRRMLPRCPGVDRNRGDGSAVMPFYAVGSTSPAGAAVATGPATDGPTTKDDDHGSDGDGATPRRLGEGAGHRVHGRRPGRRHRLRAGPGGGGRGRRRPGGGPLHRAGRRGRRGHPHHVVRRRPRGAAALDRPRPGPGRAAAVAGRPLRHRPGDRRRLLLRLRAAGRRPVQRRRPRPDRGHHAPDRRRGPAVRPRRGDRSTRAWPCSAPSRSSRRSSGRWGRGPTRSTPDRRTARRDRWQRGWWQRDG